MNWQTIVLLVLLSWPLLGTIQHHFLYARYEDDYNPLGYLLSVFPGWFVAWSLYSEGVGKWKWR